MDWWDDLWLNEGFASYIEYRGQNASEPDWHIDQFFLNDDMHGVLRLDALESSHPVIPEVANPDQITEIFDSISYSKGASVLRMLEYTIPEDLFRDGVRNYLNKFSYGNAKTQDLWNEINIVVENVRNKIFFKVNFQVYI
jgi:aminopeptidase N